MFKLITTTNTPSLPTNIIPTNIACVKLSGRFPVDMRIPPLKIKILLESDPPITRVLVRRLAVVRATGLIVCLLSIPYVFKPSS